MGRRWFPLESNPDVMNDYIKSLGVESAALQFTDVWGMDDEMLNMVPGPSHAVLFLFPVSANNEAWREAQQKDIAAHGQTLAAGVRFMHQTIDNACGTVGILHALLNNREKLVFAEGSFMAQLVEEAADKDPAALAAWLEGSDDLDKVQEEAAQRGQTANQPLEAEVDWHFICYVHRDGHLYELDGRKPHPVNCGASTELTLLKDTARYVRKYMELDPEELNFTLVSLSTMS